MKFIRNSVSLALIALLLVILTGCFPVSQVPDDGEIQISDNAAITDSETERALDSVSEDKKMLTFSSSTTFLESVKTGDILVIDATDETPYGLMRKVAEISTANSKIFIETTQATLEDLIVSGTFRIEETLTPSDLTTASSLHDSAVSSDSTSTTVLGEFHIPIECVLEDSEGNQITMNGDAFVSPTIELEATFDEQVGLERVHFAVRTEETLDLTLQAETQVIGIEMKKIIYNSWYGKRLKIYGNYYEGSCYVYVEESNHFMRVLG